MTTRQHEEQLVGLTATRAAHSRQVARTVADLAPQWVAPEHVDDVTTAALLHDVGYREDIATTGFHPLDGAAHLAASGYSPLVCHLVATHTAAHLEAHVRGIPETDFAPYLLPQIDTSMERAVLTYADLTALHTGQPCTVAQRLETILDRYDDGPVREYITAHIDGLRAAGSAPDGLLSDAARQLRVLPSAERGIP